MNDIDRRGYPPWWFRSHLRRIYHQELHDNSMKIYFGDKESELKNCPMCPEKIWRVKKGGYTRIC